MMKTRPLKSRRFDFITLLLSINWNSFAILSHWGYESMCLALEWTGWLFVIIDVGYYVLNLIKTNLVWLFWNIALIYCKIYWNYLLCWYYYLHWWKQLHQKYLVGLLNQLYFCCLNHLCYIYLENAIPKYLCLPLQQ